MIVGLIVGLCIGAAVGVVVARLCAAADRGDVEAEYAEAVEELGKALREAYAWIHVSGEWEEFERTGFTMSAPAPTSSGVAGYARERLARVQRAETRFYDGESGLAGRHPLGHHRAAIDPPPGIVRGEGRVFTRPVDPRGANPGQDPNEWGEIGRLP